MEDSKIIALFFARSEEAIAQTDLRYGRRLHSLANNIVRCWEDAEESVSDTYLRAWKSIPPQKPAHFFAYLARVCRNCALDKLDRQNAAKRRAEVLSLTTELEGCIPDACQDSLLEGKELGRILSAFLATLTPENRMVFLRRYWFAETPAEIARRFGLTESAVNTRISRTRTKLAAYLKKEGIAV